jgi:RHS repeat-associated protein
MRDYRFCGKEGRSDRIYYFGYRYFAPWIGRWLSPDPIGQQDGSNLYLYVHDNPISYYDPDGLQTTVTPIDPGKEIVVRQPRVPPAFARTLTPDKWQAFNEHKIAVMYKHGKPTVVPIEEYREWVRQQTATGRNVITVRVTHVSPSRTTGKDGDISAEQARERDEGATGRAGCRGGRRGDYARRPGRWARAATRAA